MLVAVIVKVYKGPLNEMKEGSASPVYRVEVYMKNESVQDYT